MGIKSNIQTYSKESEKNFILGLTVVCLILAFLVIRDIFALIIFSLITAYFLHPVYKFYLDKTNNERISAMLALFSGTFVVFVPFVMLMYFLVLNIIKLVLEYKLYIENPDLLNSIFSNFFEKLTNSQVLSTIDFSDLFNTVVLSVLEFSKKFTSSIPKTILYFLIVMFISYYILTYNKNILKSFNDHIPLSYRKQQEILNTITKNLKVLFKGYFFTALIQTGVAFVGYIIFGAPNLLIITFMTLITSLIPYIGPPLVWVPVSFYMIVLGDTFGGMALLLYGTFLISLVDNFIRPVLMSDKETLPPPLVFIGFVGGMFAFGISGIVLGPIIISITAIFLKYVKEYYEIKV